LKKITQKPKKTICKASNKTARKHRSIVKEEGLASPNILILGPRGTGKELVAKEIHDRISAMKNPLPVDSAGKKPEGNKTPNQKKVPYVSVNCAAIATNLFESEMFGHVKGAFTGADHNKQGKVELAEGGVLFLDEIGDLSLDHQAKLLRLEPFPLSNDMRTSFFM
jgi:transcriptional regulator with PAS, ATPase and Fis domain